MRAGKMYQSPQMISDASDSVVVHSLFVDPIVFVGARVCVRLLFYAVVLRVMSQFATTVKSVLRDHLKQTKQRS